MRFLVFIVPAVFKLIFTADCSFLPFQQAAKIGESIKAHSQEIIFDFIIYKYFTEKFRLVNLITGK
jgi:hypothetical protein